MKYKKISINIGIGTTSLLAIFVILCLVAFAILTFSTAQNDKELSEKTAKATTEYYLAQNEAEENLEKALTCISLDDEAGIASLGILYTTIDEGILLQWKTPINEKKTLVYEVLVDGNEKIMRNTHSIMER